MGTYTKIRTIMLYTLNNAEYLAFMNSVLALLPLSEEKDDHPEELSLDYEMRTANASETSKTPETQGAPDLGLSKEFVGTLEQEVLALADVVDESRIAQETEEAAVREKNRDNLATYITTRIMRAGTLPLEAERDAGKFLYKVTKPYIGIARLPVAQETAKIQGLLIDLRKEENAPYVEVLGLKTYLDELENENNAYIALTSQRTRNRAANKKESGAALRERIDGYYEDLTLLAQSYSIALPSEAATTFVKNLNQLIAETVTANNQRKKGTTTGKVEGGGKDDRPEELV